MYSASSSRSSCRAGRGARSAVLQQLPTFLWCHLSRQFEWPAGSRLLSSVCCSELRRSRSSKLVSNVPPRCYITLTCKRCCPGGCSCVQQQNQNGYIGCCPSGQTCGGSVLVQTVTVTAQAQQTDAVVVPLVYTTTTQYNPYTAPAGYCQTLTMNGPNLPRVTQGQCGTILIVNESAHTWKPIGSGVAGVFLLIQVSLMRMFRWI